MSCFWDALIRELQEEDYKLLGMDKGAITPRHFATRLQQLSPNTFVLSKWQGANLSEQLRRENAQAIASFDVSSVHNGYLCGVCDPFLLLITHLVGVHIRHAMGSSVIEYRCVRPEARCILLQSTRTHMR
jgi:hypothetical protein